MNIKINVEYIGSNYAGWQKQKNHITIQEMLEKELSTLIGEKISLVGSGRTDAGVHATDQVASFKLDKNINIEGIMANVNKKLPKDIRIKKCEKVKDDFHAQFSAISKTYLYKIKILKNIDVFEKDRIFYCKNELKISDLKMVSKFFEGEKNFINFCKKDYSGSNTIRKIESISITQAGNYINIKIKGNGFLRGMVRLIVGSMINFCKGSLSKKEIKDALNYESKPLNINFSVPPHGLYLIKVRY